MGWQDDSSPIGDTAAPPPDWKQQSTPHEVASPGILGQIGNFGRVATDAMTFGLPDTITDKIMGDHVSSQATQNARDQLGPIGSLGADMAGYVTGPGELGLGIRAAKLLGKGVMEAAPRLTRMFGGAVEGGLAAGAGTAGHGDTDLGHIGTAMALGGATGAATGALPVSRETPKTPPTSDLVDASKFNWRQAEAAGVDPQAVQNAIGNVRVRMTPGDQNGMSAAFENQLNKVERDSVGASLTAADLNDFQRNLFAAARTAKDRALAGRYGDALETAYGGSQPAIDAARTATTRMKTGQDLDSLLTDPHGAPKRVGSMLTDHPEYYGPEVTAALQRIAGMQEPSLGSRAIHGALGIGAGAGVGAGAAYLGGFNPVIGALAGAGGRYGYAQMAKSARGKPITNALNAARHLNATGDNLPPSAFAPSNPFLTVPSDILRQAGYAGGASGSY